MILFTDFILVAGFVIILMILYLLLNAKQKGISKKLLILIFLIALILNLDYYSSLHKISIFKLPLFLIDSGIEFILGPLILFYVRSLFKKDISLKKLLYHLIPFGIYSIIFTIPYFISVIRKEYILHYLQVIDNNLFRNILNNIYLILYLIFALKEYYRYQNLKKDIYSNLDDNDLNWVKRLLAGTLIILIIDTTLGILLEYDFLKKISGDIEYLTAFTIIALMAYLGYYGVKRSRILVPQYLSEPEQINIEKEKAIIKFNPPELELLKENLNKLMTVDKVFLDEELTLTSLSEKLDTTSKKISSLLNHYLNTNFYDYVNKFRVNDVIEKIKSEKYEKYTVIGIAYESGFKSKTTFNRIFKNETGMSPTEFKKHHFNKEDQT